MTGQGRAIASWVALWALCGCSGEETAGRLLEPGGRSDARYELEVWTRPPAPPATSGDLRVRVEPRPGWHLAPDAATWLRFEEAEGIQLEPSFQRGSTVLDRRALEFVAEYPGGDAGERRIRGQLKFGLCEDGDERCAIIRRDLDLRLMLGAP